MTQFTFFVGVDIASASFMACVGTTPWKLTVKPVKFDNHEDGFASFLIWLKNNRLSPEKTVVCMEATGAYSEGLAYFLFASGYTVAVEPPLNIQRKFPANASKPDELDCQYISEYACRYMDKLALWKPRAEILEKVKVLLTTRQHFSVQLTGHKNALIAVQRKKVSSDLAKRVHQDMIEQINKHIKAIDKEIRRLIDDDPNFKQTFLLLMSVPGIGYSWRLIYSFTCKRRLTLKSWQLSLVSARLNMRVAHRSIQLRLHDIMVRQFCENYFIWVHVLSVLTKSSSNNISFVKSQKASTRELL